jgi:hypothetical protein
MSDPQFAAALDRNTDAFDRNTDAFDRNTDAFDRNGAAFDRNGAAFVSLETKLVSHERFLELMLARHERSNRQLVGEVKELRADSRAQTEAIMKVVDRLEDLGPGQ